MSIYEEMTDLAREIQAKTKVLEMKYAKCFRDESLKKIFNLLHKDKEREEIEKLVREDFEEGDRDDT